MGLTSRRTVFLTGAAGVVGQALLERFSEFDLICLVHRTPVEGRNVTSVVGDITAPQFGLSDAAFHDLARRIDSVVHCAAITKFGSAEAAVFRANVDGTRNVLDLAARAQAPLYHVSTAFVHPCKYAAGALPANAYEQSKRAGEQVVRESGVPHTILRPSIVVGDSRTGAISAFQGFHLILGLAVTGALPIIPALPESYVDIIPQDVLAGTIATLIERNAVGGEYFISSGSRAPTIKMLAEMAVAAAPRVTGQRIALPRLVRPDIFERLIKPVFLPALPTQMQRMVKRALQVSRYISLEEPIPSHLQELEAAYGVQGLPDMEQSVIRNLEYWAAATGIRAERGDLSMAWAVPVS